MITPAFAQGAAPRAAEPIVLQLVPFVLIFVIMYFLILRPQQKRAKDHQEMVKNVRRGDTVVTTGGLVGRVTRWRTTTGDRGRDRPDVRVKVVRAMISEVRAKGEPVKA